MITSHPLFAKKNILKILLVTLALTAITAFIPVNRIEVSSGYCEEWGCVQGASFGHAGYGLPFTYKTKCNGYYSCYGGFNPNQFSNVMKYIVAPLLLNIIVYFLCTTIASFALFKAKAYRKMRDIKR